MSNSVIIEPEHERRRNGVPFTMYFSAEQACAIANISNSRRISKATLIRYAVERLLQQVEKGQLDLPIGIDIRVR